MKKFDLLGKEIGDVTVEDGVLKSRANSQIIKDYIVAFRSNARQWSANTKTRAEVNHSGQKPHPQKGTGRARQGYLGSPQYKGGGRVGGPRPKFDQHVSMNRKERRAAIRHLVVEKIQKDEMVVLGSGIMPVPQTKQVASFLKKQSMLGKKVLFLTDRVAVKKERTFIKSMRNIPGAALAVLDHLNGYDIVAHRMVVVMESALPRLMQLLEG